MRVISLFSGIGGSSEGYIASGAEVLAAVEFLDYQASVYRANHPKTKVYEEDIRKLDPLKILEDLGLKVGELDVLDGSPPCSSFSVSGKGSKGWGEAKSYGNRKQVTDDLFFEYIRFVDAIRPKFFVAENVKGLLLGKNKAYLSFILKSFPKEYRIKVFLLNSKDFVDSDTVKFNKADVTKGYNYTDASLIISLFTLQFIDPKDRIKVLDSIAESLDTGYGFILAEKTYPDSAFAYKVLEGGSTDYKLERTPAEEVIEKEKAIRDIMRPFEEELLVSELKKRFRSVTVIWSSFNFRSYLCIK